MLNSIGTAQLRLARAYAYVNERVTSDDLEVSQRAAAVVLELYAAAAQLASVSERVELIPDRPCISDSDAADQLREATKGLRDPDSIQLADAVRHLTEARRLLTAKGPRT